MITQIENLYWKIIPYNWRPGKIWYRVKCFFWHRYTTVKPRYLDHQWNDRCAVLPHMMFEILSQFIEKECSPGTVDWDYDEWHRTARKEMQELYDWWHFIYNKQYSAICDRLWKKAEKHSPVTSWIERDDFDEYCPQWATPMDEKLYRLYLDAVRRLEDRMDKQLEGNLHRIIEIMPYLWT